MRLLALLFAASVVASAVAQPIREVNPPPSPPASEMKAITGATLIDGRGGPPVEDATVLVVGNRIVAVGPRATIEVPDGAERVDGHGMAVLPGLIDAHFHLDGADDLPALFLTQGVTSVRDPGAWIEAYDSVRTSDIIPRLFLTGPHLDAPPPTYPHDAVVVRDEEEVRLAVERAVAAGASAIKVYFRLPLGLIAAATREASAYDLPVTAHLEIVDARDAIRAGIDAIEHVTSLGTAMMPPREAEVYRQAVLADSDARREGRYRMWSQLELDSRRTRELIDLMVQRNVFLSPTLAVFERRIGDQNVTDMHVHAFSQMLAFVGRARRAGTRVIVGSHSQVPHAQLGQAYQRELELLVDAGLTPMEAIVAGTLDNARYFRVQDHLGTIEPGKLADLILVDGNPAKDISAMRNVRRVMLNGRWVR